MKDTITKKLNIHGIRIAERIELILGQRHITKSELAKNTDISTGNLGDWKRGKSAPGANALIAISKYLEVSLDWLLSENDVSFEEVKEMKQAYFFTDKTQLNCNLDELTDEEKKFIQEYLAFAQYRKMQQNQA